MTLATLAVLAALAEKGAIENQGPTLYYVNAQMDNKALAPTPLIWKSQAVASAVFAKIGIQLKWRFDGRKPAAKTVAFQGGESLTSTLTAEIVPQAPANLNPNALGMVTFSANSPTRIHVFYDRMAPLLRQHRAHDASILGYVVAHEIGHLLRGISHHSETGAMRTRWTEDDFSKMATGQLLFTSEDAVFMRSYFAPHWQWAQRTASPEAQVPNRDETLPDYGAKLWHDRSNSWPQWTNR